MTDIDFKMETVFGEPLKAMLAAEPDDLVQLAIDQLHSLDEYFPDRNDCCNVVLGVILKTVVADDCLSVPEMEFLTKILNQSEEQVERLVTFVAAGLQYNDLDLSSYPFDVKMRLMYISMAVAVVDKQLTPEEITYFVENVLGT